MRIFFLLLPLFLAYSLAYGQSYKKYSNFRLFKGASLDALPVWGETDRDLYVKFKDNWRKYDLNKATIDKKSPSYAPDMSFKRYEMVSDTILTYTLQSKALCAEYETKSKAGREIILTRAEASFEVWAEH
jgi:hypothetical protein